MNLGLVKGFFGFGRARGVAIEGIEHTSGTSIGAAGRVTGRDASAGTID